jgi:hypothetical protein
MTSFGRLRAPALSLLCSLADHTVQDRGPGLSRDALISGALRELGVALCRGNAFLGRSGLYALTRASGRASLRSLACLSAEVVCGCSRLPVGRSPWLTCGGVFGACLVWVCLVWLAFICVLPWLFSFRHPCCQACPSSLQHTKYDDELYSGVYMAPTEPSSIATPTPSLRGIAAARFSPQSSATPVTS